MPLFTAIRDMTDPSLIVSALREVGCHFHSRSSSSSSSASPPHPNSESDHHPTEPWPALSRASPPPEDRNEAYQSAVEVLHPLAFYLQNKASEEQKVELGGMLAAKPEVFEALCDGILSPFVQETEGTSNASWLRLVLLLHVCFMECSPSLRLRRELIQCGCIHLLLTELQNMTRYVQADMESNKFSQQLIQAAALVVGNCLTDNVDYYMRLHPKTSISKALSSYLNYPDSIVQLVCRMTYHQFSYYLHQSNPGSIDSPGTISKYAQLLRASSESKQFVVRVGKLFMEASDLLKVLQSLCASSINRRALVANHEFHKALTNLLLRDGEKEVEYTLDLMLTCLTEGQPIALVKGKAKREDTEGGREEARQELLSHLPEIVQQLQGVLASQLASVEGIRTLCTALLWHIQADTVEDIHSCLLYVKCCYQYKHYGECCYWTDYVQRSTSAEAKKLRDQFLFYKAKAKFHIYQRQHVVLRRSEVLENLGEIKQSREKVYDNAREVISILGSLKAKGFAGLDSECDQFLDYALMDYARELNKRGSKDSLYCMLCHKKQAIVRSHVIPESVLKTIFEKDPQMFVTGPSSLSLDSRVKTLHTLTFNMLCNTCDNEILSYDENLFVENIVKPIYSASPVSHLEKVEQLSYGEWLYRFCAGVVFRSLALTRGTTGSTNAEEICKLFNYCRSVVKPMDKVDSPAQPAQSTDSPDTKEKLLGNEEFRIAMFFTPGMVGDQLSDQREKPGNLIRSLNSCIFQRLSNIPISGAAPGLAKKCHFFAVHFGIFTIVAFLEPVPAQYQCFLVDRGRGELTIHANENRLIQTPPGLLKIYEAQAEKAVTHHYERAVEEERGKNTISLTVLKTNVAEKPTGEALSFCLLPPGFDLKHQTNVLTMKEGHTVLLHHTHKVPSASHTVFLAAQNEHPMRPYVIIHSYLDTPRASQTFGYYVSLPSFVFKAELDANHKEMMKQIRAKDLDLFKLPAKVLPAAFKRAGLHSYQSILYHLNRNFGFDRKCVPGDGCWYCCGKCDVCLSDSTAGFLIHSKDKQLKFCGEYCQSFVDRSRAFLPSFSVTEPLKEIAFAVVPTDSEEESIVEVKSTHVLSLSLSFRDQGASPTHAAVDVYRIEEGIDGLLSGRCIALFKLKNQASQKFAEFFLTNALQLENPLPHVKIQVDKEQNQLLSEILREGILRSGIEVGHILSMGKQVTEPSAQEPRDAEDEELLVGLDFS